MMLIPLATATARRLDTCATWCVDEINAQGYETVCTWKNCNGCMPCAGIAIAGDPPAPPTGCET